jgi:flagellar protein FlaG
MGLEIPAILKSNALAEIALKEQQQVSDHPQSRQQPTPAVNMAEIESQLRALEKTFLAFNHRVKLSVNEEINQVIIKVVDSETDKVIKEIPAVEIQHLIANIKQTIGLLVDEKI